MSLVRRVFPRIFISYRRKDKHAAQRVYRDLIESFGANYIFVDQHVIQGGTDFGEQLKWALDRCEVFIAVIGREWSEEFDSSRFSLESPDWLRYEVETVLKRNIDRPPQTPSPVLIIPLRVDEARSSDRDSLPESLKSFARLPEFTYGNSDDVQRVNTLILEQLGEPPMGSHEWPIRTIDETPRLDLRHQYRFRFVRSEADLEIFVKMSAEDPTIAGANVELSPEYRYALYERWCAATSARADVAWNAVTNEVKSFLILDQHHKDQIWKPIGLTIMLPLTEEGGQYLQNSADSGEKRNASRIPASMLARDKTGCILIDTWIVAPKSDIRGNDRKPSRIDHHGYGKLMVLRHLAELWNTREAPAMTILAEPDNPQIERIIQQLGFRRINRPISSGDVFEFQYPLNRYQFGSDLRLQISRIVDRLPTLQAEWPII